MIVFSVLGPIEEVLEAVLRWLHGSIGISWAWSIVVLTLMVRMLLVPLTVKQIHSMQRLQAHLPEMKAIQARYKRPGQKMSPADKQKMNQETMAFYRENKINPAASCLPIAAQIPIFFALFYVLKDFKTEIFPDYQGGVSGETEGDLHWLGFVPNIVADPGSHWSGYVLIAVYATSQTLSTLFMSATMERAQRIMMLVLPLIFIPFIIDPPGSTVFPVGLLLYWVTTNLWTTGQGLVTRRLVPKKKKGEPPPKRSSRTPPQSAEAGNGAKLDGVAPKPKAGGPQQPRKVKRKKKGGARR